VGHDYFSIRQILDLRLQAKSFGYFVLNALEEARIQKTGGRILLSGAFFKFTSIVIIA